MITSVATLKFRSTTELENKKKKQRPLREVKLVVSKCSLDSAVEWLKMYSTRNILEANSSICEQSSWKQKK